jgi:hypothetical protein
VNFSRIDKAFIANGFWFPKGSWLLVFLKVAIHFISVRFRNGGVGGWGEGRNFFNLSHSILKSTEHLKSFIARHLTQIWSLARDGNIQNFHWLLIKATSHNWTSPSCISPFTRTEVWANLVLNVATVSHLYLSCFTITSTPNGDCIISEHLVSLINSKSVCTACHHCNEATERSPRDDGDHGCRVFPLYAQSCIPYLVPSHQLKALVAAEDYNMVINRNNPVNRKSRQMEGQTWKYGRLGGVGRERHVEGSAHGTLC